jgi:hypothetical protein
MAAEAAPQAAVAASQAASSGGGSEHGGSWQAREASKGVLLAIAIILLWLAGLCFFVAFEGSQLLAESASPTGGGLLKAMISGIAQKTLTREQQGG